MRDVVDVTSFTGVGIDFVVGQMLDWGAYRFGGNFRSGRD